MDYKGGVTDRMKYVIWGFIITAIEITTLCLSITYITYLL